MSRETERGRPGQGAPDVVLATKARRRDQSSRWPRYGTVGVTGANRWGAWEYDSTTNEVRLVNGRYEVDLDWCESSAAVLDWICQIAKKPWADDRIIADLVRAINEVVDPQRNLCSFGVEVGDVAPRRRDVGDRTEAVA